MKQNVTDRDKIKFLLRQFNETFEEEENGDLWVSNRTYCFDSETEELIDIKEYKGEKK
jgi:uncharacterized protein YhbP (UPF0306 family)